jgi:hypothetical protein
MAQNNSMSQKLRAALSGNSIGDQLKYAALHGCETKWKQCKALTTLYSAIPRTRRRSLPVSLLSIFGSGQRFAAS